MDFRKERLLQNRVTRNWIRTKSRNGLELRSLNLLKAKMDKKCLNNVKLLDSSINRLDEELQCVLTTSQPARERPSTDDILDTRWCHSPDLFSRASSSVRRFGNASDHVHFPSAPTETKLTSCLCRYGVFGDNCMSFPCHPLPARPKTASMRKTKLLSAPSRRCVTSLDFVPPIATVSPPTAEKKDKRQLLMNKLSNETVRRPQKWAIDQTVVRERALYISVAELRKKLRKTKPPAYECTYGDVNTRRTSHLRPRPSTSI